MTVTLTSGSTRSGWIKAILYDQSNTQIAVSNGNASGMGGSTTFPAALTAPAPATPGTYTWKMAYFGNSANNGSTHGEVAISTNSFTVAAAADTTAPVVGAFTLPTTATSLTVAVSSFTATDNVAVTGYLITTSATAPAASATGWTATAPVSVTAVAGSNTFFGWAKDAAGNVSLAKSASVTVTLPDAAAPVVGAFTLPATATTLTVPVSSFTATDNVGVTGYLITKSATAPAASATGWTATAPVSVTAVAGSNTFFGWAKDAAGNVSLAKSASVTVTLPDTAAPVVGAFTLPATATTLAVPVSSFTATDNVGVTGYLITTSATAPASVTAVAGSNTFYAWAKDAAGNVSLAKSASVTVTLPDATAPVVGAFTLPTTATSLTVPVSAFTATDNVGVTGYLITTSTTAPAASATGWSATAPASVTAVAGSNTFYGWAKDAAGNVSLAKSASVTVTVQTADTTKPTLTISALNNGSYTNKVTLNITGSTSDASGIKSVTVNGQAITVNPDGSFSTALTLTVGANTITVVSTDNAGNQQTDARTVTYDPNAPVLAVSAPADNSQSSQSFITISGTIGEISTVSVIVNSGSPQLASISGNSFSVTVNLAQGVNTIAITATDLAGNVSTAKRTVTYGTASMALSVTSPLQDITTKNSSISLKGKVVDPLENVTVKITMDGNTFTPKVEDNGAFEQELKFTTPKLYAITVTATDEAGNSSSVYRNVIFKPETHDDDEHDDEHDDDDHR
ncbi:hypothetical protein [Geobacter sp.]|uniref:hypothetical protein n=1 Tax=Geobacter sp. TaxID=46610 RepID=UPI0027BA5A75|nr:hypothetical protein [Geobacter sp.]